MRYFFDVTDQAGRDLDTEGVWLGTFDAMRAQAKRTLTRIASEEPSSGGQTLLSLRVRDEQGREVYHLSLHLQEELQAH